MLKVMFGLGAEEEAKPTPEQTPMARMSRRVSERKDPDVGWGFFNRSAFGGQALTPRS